jgi:hypothetical protein
VRGLTDDLSQGRKDTKGEAKEKTQRNARFSNSSGKKCIVTPSKTATRELRHPSVSPRQSIPNGHSEN